MATPKAVQEPHKELRFTRANQAQAFWIAAALALGLAALLLAVVLSGHPDFSWWHAVLPLIPAFFLAKFALHCTRHAYLILTPLGVEIFPLRNPRENLHLVYWTEITDADFDADLTKLTLHYNEQKTAGLVVTLRPILESQRPLLEKAIIGRLQER